MGGVNPDLDLDAVWESVEEQYEESAEFNGDIIDWALNTIEARDWFRQTETYDNAVQRWFEAQIEEEA